MSFWANIATIIATLIAVVGAIYTSFDWLQKKYKQIFSDQVEIYHIPIDFFSYQPKLDYKGLSLVITSILNAFHEGNEFKIKVNFPEIASLKKNAQREGEDAVYQFDRTIADAQRVASFLENTLELLFSKPFLDMWDFYARTPNDWTKIVKEIFATQAPSSPRLKNKTKFDIWRTDDPKLKSYVMLDENEVKNLARKKDITDLRQFAMGPGLIALDELSDSTILEKALPKIAISINGYDKEIDEKHLEKTLATFTWHIGLG